MLRLFSRAGRQPAALRPFCDSLRASWAGLGLGFSSAPQQQQPGEQPGAEKEQQQAARAGHEQSGRQQYLHQQQQEGQQQAAEGRGAPEEQPGGEQQSQQEEEGGSSSRNPHLEAYIASLRQLKGSTKVQQETLGSPDLPWWQQMVVGFFDNWLQTKVRDVIRARVEEEFSLEEFLEGAKDAYFSVNHLLAEDDFATLRNGMLSAKLVEALDSTKAEYRANGFGWRTELEGGIQAAIRGLSFWGREEMQQYDPERAAAAGEEDPPLKQRPSGMWLVLTVQFKAKQRVTVTRLEDGTVGADLTDWRPQSWKFATGPLPDGLPVRRLESEWFLVTI